VRTTAVLAPTSVTPFGGGGPHNNMQPFLALNFIIALEGIFPARN
jgi:microcystin-dependent protein